MYPIIHDGHIALVQETNAAKTEREHIDASARLTGFRECAKLILGNNYGSLLMSADEHYISQGIDRPMCCGVWLDWKPTDK